MLLLSSRYTSDSDLHAVFMSFLRRFLGVSRLVNLPNLNVVFVVPRRLYPLPPPPSFLPHLYSSSPSCL